MSASHTTSSSKAHAPKPLMSYKPFWAKRFGIAPFLPMSRAEMEQLGWDSCDIILVTGDAYVDHPSFGMAVIGRVLEAQGFRVGIIAQPDWHSAEPFKALGRPNLFWGVTAGNMDSMINRYTADRKIRSDDAYTPGNVGGKRPDRAAIVYSQRCREAYKDVPIILGGIEGSLRRIAHYDYWSDKVRRSIVVDSKCDLLLYGNAERALVEVAHRLARREPIGRITDVRGTAFVRRTAEAGWLEMDSTEVDRPGRVDEYTNPYQTPAEQACSQKAKQGDAMQAAADQPNGASLSAQGAEQGAVALKDSMPTAPVKAASVTALGAQGALQMDTKPAEAAQPVPATAVSAAVTVSVAASAVDATAATPASTEAVRAAAAAAVAEQPITLHRPVRATRTQKHADRTHTVVRLPSYEQVKADPVLYAHANRVLHLETNPGNARALVQRHGEGATARDVWLNPPPIPLSMAEMDWIFDLPYARSPHPQYADARGRHDGETKIPAWEMIRFSVNIMRGCFGGCTFCSITEHEGRIIQSRSANSIMREVEEMRDKVQGFTGVVSDLGGPTANMYRLGCRSPEIEAACRKPSCVYPGICPNLRTDHTSLIQLYRRVRELPGVKKVLIGSGLRYDLAVQSPAYVKELVQHHVGGYLKIAPEHTEQGPLSKMMKPGIGTYDRFKQMFEQYSAEAGKEQFLIPYFIAAHPGTTDEDMLNLALWLKKNGFRADQVQAFYPSPMATATAMYHTGVNTLKGVHRDERGEKVDTVKGERRRRLHKAFLRYHDPNNWPLLREALQRMGRADLIGNGKQHLIPRWQPVTDGSYQSARRSNSTPSRPGGKGGAVKGTAFKAKTQQPSSGQGLKQRAANAKLLKGRLLTRHIGLPPGNDY